ncbi:succinylglutamate desuccinylase [Halobacteriales archaeon SW_7_68_16]|nr:MAG: succinylglutamate desuccinylase [Halobacteriales archaeon SW_7_68_16]
MRVEQLGDGEPIAAVVGGIHGDEPCGVRAVERLIEERPTTEGAVVVIVANERAIERGVRYVEADLNRVFPGSAEADEYERRLAAEIADVLGDVPTLALHSTQSTDRRIAFVDAIGDRATRVCSRLPVEATVEADGKPGGHLSEVARAIEVECGRQGTDAAAEHATDIVRAFLGAVGVLPGERAPAGAMPVFRMGEAIRKRPASRYEVFVENMTRVEPGERVAAADGEEIVADRPFYPLLVSADGYLDKFGFRGEYAGRITESGEFVREDRRAVAGD